ncbi:MAG: HupE/UreJ family protein [Hyphomicrobiaceae bacterium]|nr:HupE/UreJ family protein [Hyphomicrobiaceae bacterium]MCC0010994.1 HupE/UreJ family protein [Hyphomicrobiaceae bacterium]
MPTRTPAFFSAVLISALLISSSAFAHTDGVAQSGFWSGLSHPISGWDHVAAMVAVGLWGAFLGQPAIWLLPVVFPMVMALGSAFGVIGIPIGGIEIGIALSAVVLGTAILLQLRAPFWLAAIIVGIFAIFHGYAHGAELPEAANPLAFAVGFVVATGLLHLAGIGLGTFIRWPAGRVGVRATGGAIALIGVAYLTGAI